MPHEERDEDEEVEETKTGENDEKLDDVDRPVKKKKNTPKEYRTMAVKVRLRISSLDFRRKISRKPLIQISHGWRRDKVPQISSS